MPGRIQRAYLFDQHQSMPKESNSLRRERQMLPAIHKHKRFGFLLPVLGRLPGRQLRNTNLQMQLIQAVLQRRDLHRPIRVQFHVYLP